MGVPGLPPSSVGVKAEIESLQKGIASLYPDINGLPALKEEASRFIKAFVNVDVAPEGCVPVTGSMQGTFASFLTQKVKLAPGEEKAVTLTIDKKALSFFDDAKHEWVAEPGKFEAIIGSSSRDIKGIVPFELK